MRIFILIFITLMTGCSINKTLPHKDKFSESILSNNTPDKAQLIVYSKSDDWLSGATYKYIVLNGVHVSTITKQTFGIIETSPGTNTLRVTQHGYDGVELPAIFSGPVIRKKFEDTIEFDVTTGTTIFIAIDYKLKDINFQCGETESAIKICTKQEEGIVLSLDNKDEALSRLVNLYEVCHECD